MSYPKKVFGQWSGRWGWRVEYVASDGSEMSMDFYQEELKPGKDKSDADEFVKNLRIEQRVA